MIRYSEERGDRANANVTRNGVRRFTFDRELIFRIYCHHCHEILIFNA